MPLFPVPDRIESDGYPIVRTRASVTVNNTLTFFPDVQVSAAVFAFRFWFIHQGDIIVQIYRPTGTGNNHTLVHEIKITPSVDNNLEDVSTDIGVYVQESYCNWRMAQSTNIELSQKGKNKHTYNIDCRLFVMSFLKST